MFGDLVIILAGLVAAGSVPAAHSTEDLADPCAHGIALAFQGRIDRADSVFVAMLSSRYSDPRALNNSGNVCFMRGDLDVALQFYELAARSDSSDAGILLNRAAVLLVMGEDDRARQVAAEAVRHAGSPERAEQLIGIPRTRPGKASEFTARILAGSSARRKNTKLTLSRSEMRALIRGQEAPVSDPHKAPSEAPQASSGGARTGVKASAEGSLPRLLYWKR